MASTDKYPASTYECTAEVNYSVAEANYCATEVSAVQLMGLYSSGSGRYKSIGSPMVIPTRLDLGNWINSRVG